MFKKKKKNKKNNFEFKSDFDVLGSYTGNTSSDDEYERPIQDADDL
ncbi:MAG: hypothetical protein IJF75_00745 [Clostridia bacterium]|nr:hypothetical protein [Clostridia bacterium]